MSVVVVTNIEKWKWSTLHDLKFLNGCEFWGHLGHLGQLRPSLAPLLVFPPTVHHHLHKTNNVSLPACGQQAYYTTFLAFSYVHANIFFANTFLCCWHSLWLLPQRTWTPKGKTGFPARSPGLFSHNKGAGSCDGQLDHVVHNKDGQGNLGSRTRSCHMLLSESKFVERRIYKQRS